MLPPDPAPPSRCRSPALLAILPFALTCFGSAFLLFQVQPLLGKYMLPWFGGSPGVWTTAMLFFQVLLLGGYLYAHLTETLLRRPQTRLAVHVVLAVAALLCLPIIPSLRFRPDGSEQPTVRILALLFSTVGLPYLLLSATGPLTQAWLARRGQSPYRLYALSNAGSLLALLSYPFVVEPLLPVTSQARLWSLAFALLLPLWLLCAVLASRQIPDSQTALQQAAVEQSSDEKSPPSRSDRILTTVLPALACVALLATTSHLCEDVAVVPFLWVVPLVIYLLSFILCFDHPRWYRRSLFGSASLLLLAALIVSENFEAQLGPVLSRYSFARNLLLDLLLLFCTCMICHGELSQRRPPPRYLTGFYLRISVGGALGGLLIAVLSPLLISRATEWYLTLLISFLLALLLRVADETNWRLRLMRMAPLLLATVGMGLALRVQQKNHHNVVLAQQRNFYGEVQVHERAVRDPMQHDRVLFHSGTIHGVQYQHPKYRRDPITYYDDGSGIGLAMAHQQNRPDLRIGLVGLGVGTLTAYGHPGHSFRIYELNPAVAALARSHFHYLSDSPSQITVVLGDARLSLDREPRQQFHILVLDAFSGDAIPTHLLTREALQIYLRHLQPEGTLAIHITNRYIDLAPVVKGLAESFGLSARRVRSPQDDEHEIFAADWILLTRDQSLLHELQNQSDSLAGVRTVAWTDESSPLLQLLKR